MTKININGIYIRLPEGILVSKIITRFKQAILEGTYAPTMIEDITTPTTLQLSFIAMWSYIWLKNRGKKKPKYFKD